MSLKNFHLLFVVCATVMALFCAVQALAAYRATGDGEMAVVAAGAVIAAALLVRVEAAFLKQWRSQGVR